MFFTKQNSSISAQLGQKRILIFGEKYGTKKPQIKVDYCDVQFAGFPSDWHTWNRLAEYDLVILDYEAFIIEQPSYGQAMIAVAQQEVFLKQMVDALEAGTTFCFLHYDVTVPNRSNYIYTKSGFDKDSQIQCRAAQIGYWWLDIHEIKPIKANEPILNVELKRSEFNNYLRRWGTSKTCFTTYGDGKFEDVLFGIGDQLATGFALKVKNGNLIYLPYQRDLRHIDTILTSLLDSLVTYISRTSTQVPSWAEAPIFKPETELVEQLTETRDKVAKLETQLEMYQSAKQLAFMREYQFEKAMPAFLQTHFGLAIEQIEEYEEDFWILNANGDRAVIVETKTNMRGMKRNATSQLDLHRQARDLDDSFPALLIVNCNLNAGSWQEKIRPIDPQIYKRAAQDNITIMRVEDILFFWNAQQENEKFNVDLLQLLTSTVGWIEVSSTGHSKIHI